MAAVVGAMPRLWMVDLSDLDQEQQYEWAVRLFGSRCGRKIDVIRMNGVSSRCGMVEHTFEDLEGQRLLARVIQVVPRRRDHMDYMEAVRHAGKWVVMSWRWLRQLLAFMRAGGVRGLDLSVLDGRASTEPELLGLAREHGVKLKPPTWRDV